MNRKAFIQQALIAWMPHFKSNKACIERAKRAWDDLSAEGFGETTETSRSSRNWYAELEDQEAFDKCWFKYGKQGSRDKAAKAWIEIEESQKEKIYPAIPKYLEDIRCSGTAKAHFSTWLNDKRWLNYDADKKQETKPVYDEKSQEIAHLKRQIAMMPEGPTKEALQVQLNKLLGVD